MYTELSPLSYVPSATVTCFLNDTGYSGFPCLLTVIFSRKRPWERGCRLSLHIVIIKIYNDNGNDNDKEKDNEKDKDKGKYKDKDKDNENDNDHYNNTDNDNNTQLRCVTM